MNIWNSLTTLDHLVIFWLPTDKSFPRSLKSATWIILSEYEGAEARIFYMQSTLLITDFINSKQAIYLRFRKRHLLIRLRQSVCSAYSWCVSSSKLSNIMKVSATCWCLLMSYCYGDNCWQSCHNGARVAGGKGENPACLFVPVGKTKDKKTLKSQLLTLFSRDTEIHSELLHCHLENWAESPSICRWHTVMPHAAGKSQGSQFWDGWELKWWNLILEMVLVGGKVWPRKWVIPCSGVGLHSL